MLSRAETIYDMDTEQTMRAVAACHEKLAQQYLSYLPPLLPARTNGSGSLDTSNMSTQELSRLYGQMLTNPTIGTEPDPGPVIDVAAEISTMERHKRPLG